MCGEEEKGGAERALEALDSLWIRGGGERRGERKEHFETAEERRSRIKSREHQLEEVGSRHKSSSKSLGSTLVLEKRKGKDVGSEADNQLGEERPEEREVEGRGEGGVRKGEGGEGGEGGVGLLRRELCVG